MKVQRVGVYKMHPRFCAVPTANSDDEVPATTILSGGAFLNRILGSEVSEFLRLKYNCPFFVRRGGDLVLMCINHKTVEVLGGLAHWGHAVSAELDDGRIIEGNIYQICEDDLDGDARVLVECPPEKLVRLL